MKITAITCTFGRPEALKLCEGYMTRQTRQPDQWLILDDDRPMPVKLLKAIESGLVEGDAIVFVEDDDYYRPGWIEWCEKQLARGFDIVGQGNAIYYQVRWRWLSACRNVRHASLCNTAISREMFDPLCNILRDTKHPFFDVALWHLEAARYLHLPKTAHESLVIGIKGMPGTVGYSSEHKQINGEGVEWDPNMAKLREVIGEDVTRYEPFYKEDGGIKALAGCGRTRDLVNYGTMPTVEVHILTHDNEQMLEYALRHYITLASRIVVHDGGPEGKSAAIARAHGVECRPWDTAGQLNDGLAMELKNSCWRETTADWVICVDCDELLFFPRGARHTLRSYESMGAAVIKPYGHEMFSETLPTGPGQIYDEIKMGGRDDKWYAKPVLFRPAMVAENGFGIGAHESRIVLHDGRRLFVGQDWPKADPPTYLLHFKAIGPIEHVAARYDATRRRLSLLNEKHGWGNIHDTGMEHALKKRAIILETLKQVIA